MGQQWGSLGGILDMIGGYVRTQNSAGRLLNAGEVSSVSKSTHFASSKLASSYLICTESPAPLRDIRCCLSLQMEKLRQGTGQGLRPGPRLVLGSWPGWARGTSGTCSTSKCCLGIKVSNSPRPGSPLPSTPRTLPGPGPARRLSAGLPAVACASAAPAAPGPPCPAPGPWPPPAAAERPPPPAERRQGEGSRVTHVSLRHP